VTYVFGVRSDLVSNFVGVRYYAAIPILVAGLAVAAVLANRIFGWKVASGGGATVAASVLVSTCVVQTIVFGSFNPVMAAWRITDPVDSQVVRDWRALYRMNNEKPIAVVGNYGHLLRGEGLAALEAIHLANVDDNILSALFPQLSEGERNEMFNRFNGVAFGLAPRVAIGATNVFPAEGYAVAFRHTITLSKSPSQSAAGPVDVLATMETQSGTVNVWWQGVLRDPADVAAALSLDLPCKVTSSWVTRFPLAIQGEALVGTALKGIGGRIELDTPDVKAASICAGHLAVTVGPAANQAPG
jgi:hypothetical protein